MLGLTLAYLLHLKKMYLAKSVFTRKTLIYNDGSHTIQVEFAEQQGHARRVLKSYDGQEEMKQCYLVRGFVRVID